MAPATKTLSVLHRCAVAPATDTAELRLPLTYLDIFWIYFHPIKRLLFYQHPCSAADFLQTIVPNLKNSLSKTLRHYLPVAGNLYHPLDSGIPDLRYFSGDSVTVTFMEASETADFSYLIGNRPREADEFRQFVPELPESRTDSEYKISPLLAIQVTLFPGIGIAVGVTNHHILGDASSIVGFVNAWSSAANLDGEIEISQNKIALPIIDRSLIDDPTDRLNIYWNQLQNFNVDVGDSPSHPTTSTNKLRSTFILKKNDIEKLKKSVLEREKCDSIHLSSFTVTTAYFWNCINRAAGETGEKINDEDDEFFGFAVDVRSRMEPPAPAAYFGNCLMFVLAFSKHGEIKGEDGFFVAAKLIGDLIRDKVNKKEELMRDADDLMVAFGSIIGKRGFSVSGSPKFDMYGVDFGWGKPVKHEVVSIDGDDVNLSISLCKSREFDGGLEIGVCLPEKTMTAFAAVFNHGLMI